MKIRKNHVHLFILLFAVSSLLVHSPSDFDAYAAVDTWTDATTTAVGSTQMNGVSMSDANNGVAVGLSGQIVYTTDGGDTWTDATTTNVGNTNMYGVSMSDANNGVAVGASQSRVTQMVYTTDGGDTWTDATTTNTEGLTMYGVSMSDANNGVAVGHSGRIVYTTNGGVDWTEATTTNVGIKNMYGVSMSDANNGVAVGESSQLIGGVTQMVFTDDGGDTWTDATTTNTDSNTMRGVSMSDANNGVAVGVKGTIVYTTNGGVDWTEATTTNVGLNGMLGVSMSDANNGVAVGLSGQIVYTTDGGDTWTDATTTNVGNTQMTGVSMIDANNGVAVGYSGQIVFTDTVSSGGSGGSSRDNNDDALINPNPYLTDEILVSVGPNKAIVTQNDGISNIQIQKGDSITITLNVVDGGPVHQTNHYYGQSDIKSVSLYTNFGSRPAAMNLYHANHFNDDREVSKTFYEWNANRDNVVYDFTKSVEWHNPVVRTASFDTISDDSNTSTGNKLIITFYSTWNDVIPKSEILVKVADAMMGYSVITLPFTLQVGDYDPSFEDLFGHNTNYKFVPLVIDSNVRESIHQWVDPLSGMTDERFVSSLGLDGDELPGYVKHLAQWVVEDKIDLADLIIAVEYIINVK